MVPANSQPHKQATAIRRVITPRTNACCTSVATTCAKTCLPSLSVYAQRVLLFAIRVLTGLLHQPRLAVQTTFALLKLAQEMACRMRRRRSLSRPR